MPLVELLLQFGWRWSDRSGRMDSTTSPLKINRIPPAAGRVNCSPRQAPARIPAVSGSAKESVTAAASGVSRRALAKQDICQRSGSRPSQVTVPRPRGLASQPISWVEQQWRQHQRSQSKDDSHYPFNRLPEQQPLTDQRESSICAPGADCHQHSHRIYIDLRHRSRPARHTRSTASRVAHTPAPARALS